MNAPIDPVDPDLYYIPKAKPILKWVGGKRELVPVILKQIERIHPGEIHTYYEPFLGGGAVFFALRAAGKIRHAVLSDTNEELINFYLQIQNEPERYIRAIRQLEKKKGFSEKSYYEVRADAPRSDAARAARFKYINACGYNGLWRVNKQNKCNVPWGLRVAPGRPAKIPALCDEEALWAAHHALACAELKHQRFQDAIELIRIIPGFVYFDPPYWPTRPTANFTSYTSEDFNQREQERLRYHFYELTRRGTTPALLSNSDVPATRKLYGAFKKKKVSARRSVNSDGAKREAVSELLVESRFRE